jgi:hypothetical protein
MIRNTHDVRPAHMKTTGLRRQPPGELTVRIPLATCADEALRRLVKSTGAEALQSLDGDTLLGERATLRGMRVPGRICAGGGCRLLAAAGDTIALNLARASDRELLPALFETDQLNTSDDDEIASWVARSDAGALLARGRAMGLAIAAENERRTDASGLAPWVELSSGPPAQQRTGRPPRVLDLSALWAGPLAGHLLWLAGAEVTKLESRTRPDAMRTGDPTFHALLNQGKRSIVLDLTDTADRHALLELVKQSDIVIEAARPRALAQLGIEAEQIVHHTPGLVWVSITGHGARGEAANWVGFGDDCGVAGGLSAALRAATGRTGFVGDAIADPLTGIFAALAAWEAWQHGRGGRFGLAMSDVVAHCLAAARRADPAALEVTLQSWAAAEGQSFPPTRRRPIRVVR